MTPEERKLMVDGSEQIGIELTESELYRFDLFTKELLRWNAKLNLTSLRNVNDIIVKHYLDSLTVSTLIPTGARLLDIGSGGGFPSIPLKIIRNDLDIVSVDSVLKKINFQRQAARLLEFDKFRAIHARVEDLYVEYAGEFYVVTARAVSDISVLGELAVPFLADGGKLIAMKGSNWREEVARSEPGIDFLGLYCVEVIELRLPFSGDLRGLVVLERKKAPAA